MKCTYCMTEIGKGMGTVFVYKTGNMAYYCSNRCYTNHIILKRSINKKLVKSRNKVVAAPQKETPAAKK